VGNIVKWRELVFNVRCKKWENYQISFSLPRGPGLVRPVSPKLESAGCLDRAAAAGAALAVLGSVARLRVAGAAVDQARAEDLRLLNTE
jgi:hypothetical protein